MIAWDADQGRYIDDAGQPLSAAAVTTIRDAMADEYEAALGQLAERYADGELDRDQFAKDFDALLVEMIGAGAATGRGGAANLSDADYDQLLPFIEAQRAWFRGFLAEIDAAIADAKARLEAGE